MLRKSALGGSSIARRAVRFPTGLYKAVDVCGDSSAAEVKIKPAVIRLCGLNASGFLLLRETAGRGVEDPPHAPLCGFSLYAELPLKIFSFIVFHNGRRIWA